MAPGQAGREDPTLRNLRSGFGVQVKGASPSNPQWGFGTAHRDDGAKLYLSPEQTKTLQGNNSQGPVYKAYESIGPQPESKYATLPSSGFGTSTRSINYKTGNPGPGTYKQEGGIGPMTDSRRSTEPRTMFSNATREQVDKVWLDSELMKVQCGKDSPGPCQYAKPSGLGPQLESRYATQPQQKMGTAQRFDKVNLSKDTPGAGSYKCAEAFGKQALSSKATMQHAKIGTSNRDQAKKVFVSREHEKCTFGEIGPGPATGPIVPCFGKQQLSVKKSNPSWGFGTGKRSPGYGADTPGPGAYWA
ncbi:hypothetical protein FOA52_010432 [Chlamydomonas sp. UWO 241]|nr:hypothetical protein FOA52_010432 [Chlamydomonas sp. UWO 241]